MVARPRPAVLGAAVHFSQAADAHRFAKVNVARDRCGAGVEPFFSGEDVGKGGKEGGKEGGR